MDDEYPWDMLVGMTDNKHPRITWLHEPLGNCVYIVFEDPAGIRLQILMERVGLERLGTAAIEAAGDLIRRSLEAKEGKQQ